jgi:GGDEF domain-containing protein
MNPAPSRYRRVAIPATLVLLSTATIALGALAGVGAWLVGVAGGVMLGGIVTFLVLGISGASASLVAAQLAEKFDPVTTLPVARKLEEDLEEVLAADPPQPHWLHMFALEGLKRYDDAYGEHAADTLLRWLAARLRDAVGDRGTVYRMRGASLAVLSAGDEEAGTAVCTDASAALFEVGDGFMVWSVGGEVALPQEAPTAAEAIALVDRRARSKRAATNPSMHLRPPDDPFGDVSLDHSHQEVGRLARAVGARFDLDEAELDELEAAAQLRDVGNVAIPSVVFMNPGALPALEWEFVRLHTVVGERLLDGRFAMAKVARLVRSSHERWDGAGYPDGLSGERIPLASRIVFACSAYEDMCAERSHRPSLSPDEALAELRRGAGTQFDPAVIEAVAGELADAEERVPAPIVQSEVGNGAASPPATTELPLTG